MTDTFQNYLQSTEDWFYYSTIPVMIERLGRLSHLLLKAQVHNFPLSCDYLSHRLYADMMPLREQVRLACTYASDFVCYVNEQEEKVLFTKYMSNLDCQQAVTATVSWLRSVPKQCLAGHENDIVYLKTDRVAATGEHTKRKSVAHILLSYWTMPNIEFHITTVHNILRSLGLPIGKNDYLDGSLSLRSIDKTL